MWMKSCEEFLKQLKKLKETHPPHHPAVMKALSRLHQIPRQRKAGSCISWQKHLQYPWMSNLDVSKRRCCCTNHTAKDGGLWHYGEWFCWCTLWLSMTFWTWLCQSNRLKFSKNCLKCIPLLSSRKQTCFWEWIHWLYKIHKGHYL